MAKNINMTEGKPAKLLFVFALPLMFGNVFQQLYTVVDTAIVGQGVGLEALAALGTVDWITWMMLGIAQGYSQGFSVRIAQKYGEGDRKGLQKVIGQSASLAIILAIICLVLGQIGLPALLFLLRVPDELMGMGTLYIRIIIAGIPATMFYNYVAAVLRAIGDSKTPLKAMVVAAVTNIVLDILAVFVLHLGIGGAAIATVVSQVVSGIICAWKMKKTPELYFEKTDMQRDAMLQKNLIKIGTPAAMKNVIIALGGMVVQSIANGFGMSFIAGFTATNKLYGLLEIAAISYGYALTTYVGQNYGARQLGRIKTGVRSAAGVAVATSIVIAVLMFIFGRDITMLFISADSVELMTEAGNTAYLYLCVMSSCLPILYLLYVYLSAIQGTGNTIVPMISGIVEFAMRVGISLLIGYTGFENGIFAAEVAAWSGATFYLYINYRRIIRKIAL